MPRFFVDFDDGNDAHSDEVGSDLVDLAEVRLDVIRFLSQVARDKPFSSDNHTLTAVIRDVAGNGVYQATLTFHGERL